jgi:hypothetical protein
MDLSPRRIEFMKDMVEGMTVENLYISPLDDDIGVMALSNKEDDKYILRLYQLLREGKGKDAPLLPTHELEAFSFDSRLQLNLFLEQLPEMSAFDLLMVMNRLPALQ